MKAFGSSLGRIFMFGTTFLLLGLYISNIFVNKDYNPLNIFNNYENVRTENVK